MRYDKFDRRYKELANGKHPVKDKAKRDVKVYVASRRMATCTIRRLKSKIFSEKGLNISIGLLHYLKPFFVTNPTDKEKVLCMCKLCLNFRLKFNALMTHSKEFDGPPLRFDFNILHGILQVLERGKRILGIKMRSLEKRIEDE